MKLLTITVPCYNSQDYLLRCVSTLLPGGEDIEILIVNDGSTDATGAIADELSTCYPDIVRVIHQENGGHGSGVMTGIQNASGLYFKVVDSDDWVDGEAYQKILATLRDFEKNSTKVDLLVSNYVYDKVDVKNKRVVRYSNALSENRVLTWDDVGDFRKGQYILMHSVIYRTQLLRECGLKLPRHTYYVDNLYVYVPMNHVENLYYLNVDFYHYFIGRKDQSVNEKVMIKNIDQQLRVNKLMIQNVDIRKIKNDRLRSYMINYLEIITSVSSILLIRSGTQENLDKKKQLWDFIKSKDRWLYNKLNRGIMGQIVNLPGRSGRYIARCVYKLSQKVVGFN